MNFHIKAITEIAQPKIKAPAGMGRKGRPAKISRIPKRHTGPRFLHGYADPLLGPDYCAPWPGFVTATTSLSEQMLYAAFAIYFGNPIEYWKPPYDGGKEWRYQSNIAGGRLLKGGQVCDYEVDYGVETMCVRLQSERWHVMAEHAKQVDDMYNKTHTMQGMLIRDIYEQDFIADCTLRSAVAQVANVMSGREASNPILFGTARQVRR